MAARLGGGISLILERPAAPGTLLKTLLLCRVCSILCKKDEDSRGSQGGRRQAGEQQDHISHTSFGLTSPLSYSVKRAREDPAAKTTPHHAWTPFLPFLPFLPGAFICPILTRFICSLDVIPHSSLEARPTSHKHLEWEGIGKKQNGETKQKMKPKKKETKGMKSQPRAFAPMGW